MRTLGITIGEVMGIGPELIARTLPSLIEKDVKVRIYVPHDWMEFQGGKTNHTLLDHPLVAFLPNQTWPLKAIKDLTQKQRANLTIESLETAIEDANKKIIDVIVTAPLDKSIIQKKYPDFTGHTEFLREKTGVPSSIMMLDNGIFRIALLTNHIPLSKVSSFITQDHIEKTVRQACDSLNSLFGLQSPRVAVLGLNPHAGELSNLSEEKTVFHPAITALQNTGIDIHGPFPADSFFPSQKKEKWDLVISPYHDQALVAAKYEGLDRVVNITLGLPFLRVSPGHGVAYDKVGSPNLQTGSFKRALQIASTGEL